MIARSAVSLINSVHAGFSTMACFVDPIILTGTIIILLHVHEYNKSVTLFGKQTAGSLLPLMQVCVWQCLETPNFLLNTTAVCIVPSNETVARATLTVLEFFGWRRTLTLSDSTTSQELYDVSHYRTRGVPRTSCARLELGVSTPTSFWQAVKEYFPCMATISLYSPYGKVPE